MSTISHLHHFIHRHGLLPPGARVVVGVSGGPDSLALLHALNYLAPERGWCLHVAHLHHGLRPEADEEALFVAEVASAWGLGCTVERADVRSIAEQPGVSLEEAARQVRYAFLGSVAKRLRARYVAVGHNADDQAETVLMHLLRGSGLAGLRGMLPSAPLAGLRLTALPPEQKPEVGDIRLVRPWLETSRAEILAYCQAHDLNPRYDESNTDQTFFRNRLRHEVMPLLQQINPRLTQVLGRTAAALQGEYEVLERHRRTLWRHLAEVQDGRVRMRLSSFRALPRGDQRALLRRAMSALRPEHRNLAWEHSERLLDILASDPDRASGGPYPLVAGLTASLNYEWLDIEEADAGQLPYPQIHTPRTLSLPGRVALAGPFQLEAREARKEAGPAPWRGAADANILWLPAGVPAPLLVRPRRPGDVMRPFGLGGHKTISALMTDLKLPRASRAAWPLLVDARGEILWLVGKRASEACRIAEHATTAWEIRLVRDNRTVQLNGYVRR